MITEGLTLSVKRLGKWQRGQRFKEKADAENSSGVDFYWLESLA